MFFLSHSMWDFLVVKNIIVIKKSVQRVYSTIYLFSIENLLKLKDKSINNFIRQIRIIKNKEREIMHHTKITLFNITKYNKNKSVR